MYICVCKGVTNRQIQKELDKGGRKVRELHDSLGVTGQCGRCGNCVKRMLKESKA
ncbi:(2Fe-2S)-binding protein [Magnetococcus sp. PR-3]|uniref:(2Fe-2S)-binding protein n=1 Tax=Magnetococcus sp. PR-3 TaxID=3120355 RepID=UPI002FCE1E9A